jgi:xylan 1,4-beta-xylosidase
VGDLRYQVEVELQPDAGCQGGLILQYNQKMFVGIGFDGTKLSTYNGGQEQSWMRKDLSAARLWLRMENNRNVITFWHSVDGSQWTKVSWQMEVSGLHHNVFGGFLSLRPSLFSVGTGAARYRNFKYQGALS